MAESSNSDGNAGEPYTRTQAALMASRDLVTLPFSAAKAVIQAGKKVYHFAMSNSDTKGMIVC